MIGRHIESGRLKRARGISNSKIKEFEIVSNVPLVTYMLIQGSSKKPYIVIIDLKTKEIQHSCPDYNKRRQLCKHVGKLLLELKPSQVEQVNNAFNRLTIKSKPDVKLQELKNSKIQASIEDIDALQDQDFNITDGIASLLSNPSNVKLLNKIEEELEKSFKEITPYLSLLQIELHCKKQSGSGNQSFRNLLGNFLIKHTKLIFQDFKVKFNVRNNMRNLEFAYILSYISKYLNFSLKSIDIDISKLSERKKSSTFIIIDVLYRYQPLYQENYLNQFGLSKDEILSSYKKIQRDLQFKGVASQDLKNFIQKQTRDLSNYEFERDAIDNFLIYLVENENPNVRHEIFFKDDIGFLPGKLLETNHALRYAIGSLKGSDRDYVTRVEHSQHNRFFTWLAKGKKSGQWVESPRTRIQENLLDTNGIIVQWELNALKLFPEKYHALEGSTRLVVNKSNPYFRQIQPFDFTFNEEKIRRNGEHSGEAIPKALLQPDQVVRFVLQGTRIISNVLPWNILSEFVQTGYLNSGDVQMAINHCKEHQFVYGSIALQQALKDILKLGKTGISDSAYTQIYKEIATGSSRSNLQNRPLLRKLIIAEGETLQSLTQLSDYDEKKMLNDVLKACRTSPTINQFRLKMVREFISQFRKKKVLEINLEKFMNTDFGHYALIKTELQEYYLKEAENLYKILNSQELSHLKKVLTNPIGRKLCEQFGINAVGQINEDVLKQFSKYLEQITKLKKFKKSKFPKIREKTKDKTQSSHKKYNFQKSKKNSDNKISKSISVPNKSVEKSKQIHQSPVKSKVVRKKIKPKNHVKTKIVRKKIRK